MASQSQSPNHQAERRAQILDRLLRSERSRLLRQVRFHSQRLEDAEDALSDACVQFLRFYDGPAGTAALRWMLVVAKRCAWAISRQRRERVAVDPQVSAEWAEEDLKVLVRDGADGPVELAERSAETARVIEAIEQLKSDERTALILFGLGCSYSEIGELRSWSTTYADVYVMPTSVRKAAWQAEIAPLKSA
ncbi:MAG TPA: hypothetical protein VND98_06885 [Solirubrobacterales bacterium]|nr:hypothetical protein [Solirubrobacterales bacterium]